METNNNLYNVYRPDSFDQVYENEDLIETLDGFLNDRSKCPHSFLFTGPSGCGKTTIGRVFSQRLGCKTNYHEIDSGNLRGIDTVREIRQQMVYKPIGSDVRVWLIDEVHKLTNDAQNNFLKVLEDAPPHVYFILCTTEPNRLIETFRNRCSQFQVQLLSENSLTAIITGVAKAEKQKLEKDVVQQIVHDSLGSGRAALSILQKVLVVKPEKRLAMAKQAAIEQNQIIDLCRALFDNSGWKNVSKILSQLKDKEPEEIRRSVLGYSSTILLKGGATADRAAFIIETFWESTWNTGFPGIAFNCYSIIKG
jgi:DNA polymerase III gamma/tau subunit